MIVKGLYVSSAQVMLTTPLSQSVDPDIITPIISLAQYKYIVPVLGWDLHSELENIINYNTSSITTDQRRLIEEYITPALCAFTFCELVPNLRLRFVNNSVTIMNSNQSTGASYDDLKPIINQWRDMGEFHRQRLINYLCKNQTLFPKYSTDTEDQLSATTNNYYSGLNIDRGISKKDLQLKSIISAAGIKGFN
tara:strand:- start:9303 stop:9884 length:582 start_codon:yes stop_codon:yes gene_type:complete